MNWTSIIVELPKDIKEIAQTKEALNAIGFQLKPKRHKSSVWARLGPHKYWHKDIGRMLYYEILVPDIGKRETELLKELGYEIKSSIDIPKHVRRSSFSRVLSINHLIY